MSGRGLRAAVWLCAAMAALAGMSQAGDFSLVTEKRLHVLHNAEPLIVGDSLTYGDPIESGELDAREMDGMTVVNLWKKDNDTLQFRREAGVQRKRVELTIQARMFAYKNTTDNTSCSYTFRVPFDRLKNTEFKALTGRAHGPKVVTGALGATRADGQIVQGPRYIAFKGPDTRLVFDLNPKGLSTGMDYGGGGFIGRWTVTKKGDFVEFSVGINASFFGGTFAAKALIYEGEYAFSKAHPIGKLAYFDIYPSTAQYCFGTASAPEGWTKLDTAAYGGKRTAGWGNPTTVTLTANPGKALIHNAATGKGGNVFVLDVTPGIYSVTLRAGGADAGPFNVSSDGEVKLTDVRVKTDAPIQVGFQHYCRSGKLRIEFNADDAWAVSSVLVQPIITQYEDFAIDRKPWLVDGIFTPEG